eukprot:gene8502-17534_t
MSTMNIAGLTPVEDPSYRYKMPRITAKVEGRGNGIKTVLTNIFEVALSLNREAPEITKYFGCEMGSQTTFSAEIERAVVNGNHNAQDLQNKLSTYIEQFVLCKQCRLPETSYRIKNGIIAQKCAACGSKDNCDMTHKLATFILNQYKKAKADKEKDKSDKGEKGEKKKKEKKSKDDNEDGEGTTVAADGETAAEGKEEKKVKKDKKSKKKKSDENVEVDENVEEEETDSKAVDASIERFIIWQSQNPTPTTAQIIEELWSVQTCNGLPAADRVLIFLGAVFTETSLTDNSIEKYKDILSALTSSQIQQRQLIAGCEWFCGTKYPKLIKMFPIMLKHLYDNELVEEDVLLEWAADYSKNDYTVEQSLINLDTLEQLKVAAQPFITWLQQAEEEEDDEEDEDEDA